MIRLTHAGVVLAACHALACGAPVAVDAFEPIDCNAVPHSSFCSFDVWPNSGSSANSDRWLVANHDALREIRPRLLVLNFDNEMRGEAILESINARIRALAEGSRYHGYVDYGAPAFVQYELAGVVDYTDEEPSLSPGRSSTRVPVGAGGRFDVQQLFTSDFTFPDPAGSDEEVGLCSLFESGAINEVWLAVTESGRQPPLMLERKQRYDDELSARPGDFNACLRGSGSSPDLCLEVDCGVTVRFAHLNPDRGTGCDLQVRGWSIVETGASIPYFAENATAFFNADFRERFGASFDRLSDICIEDQVACMTYPSTGVAQAILGQGELFDPYRQGCGTPEFPPNARWKYEWDGSEPVASRCEHYGMGDGENGDAYEIYNASKLAVFDDLMPEDTRFPNDCGGGWQVYWRQSMPGLDNQAFSADGERMKNWWPFMFY